MKKCYVCSEPATMLCLSCEQPVCLDHAQWVEHDGDMSPLCTAAACQAKSDQMTAIAAEWEAAGKSPYL
ncbi:MAG TPA: hypothetical protein VLL52_19350 [Anaerolineae bacterium]|nr:hypothetical protein [Anaerolineae bacterium]